MYSSTPRLIPIYESMGKEFLIPSDYDAAASDCNERWFLSQKNRLTNNAVKMFRCEKVAGEAWDTPLIAGRTIVLRV